MIDSSKQEKIARFLHDISAAEAVYEVLFSHLMKKRDGDVNSKAAQMMAIELFNEGWGELKKYSNTKPEHKKNSGQVGM